MICSSAIDVRIFIVEPEPYKHGHHAKVPTKIALVSGRNCAAREKTFVMCRGARINRVVEGEAHPENRMTPSFFTPHQTTVV
jgi:hypothetical protein